MSSASSPAGSSGASAVCPRCGSRRVADGLCQVCGAEVAVLERQQAAVGRLNGLAQLDRPAPLRPTSARARAATAAARQSRQRRSLLLPLTLGGVGGAMLLVAAVIALLPPPRSAPDAPAVAAPAAATATAQTAATAPPAGADRPTSAAVSAGLDALPADAAEQIRRLTRVASGQLPDGPTAAPDPGNVARFQAKAQESARALEQLNGGEAGPPDDPEELARTLGIPVEALPAQYRRASPTKP